MRLTPIKIITVIVVLAGGFIAYRMYNKAHVSIQGLAPDYEIKSTELVSEFTASEEAANEKYLGKILQVDGEIEEILGTDPTPTILVSGNEMNHVQAVFAKNMTFQPEVGKSILLKGRCSGYLMDVILIDCVIVNEDR
jgi:uncharacterized protein (DUF1330 family)